MLYVTRLESARAKPEVGTVDVAVVNNLQGVSLF
jgi:hypothetical protein